jgi:hypothetical protein
MTSINKINNATNNNNNFYFIQKELKQEDSKLEAYILRKQISMSISACFMPTKMENPEIIPTKKMNLKCQVEELQKLQSEVSYMENKIRELELSKRVKQTKV